MNRRIRTSPGLSRRAAARAAMITLVAGLGASAAACSSDLFHDTKWQSRCDAEPDAAICPQGAGGGGGSATSNAATTTNGSTSGSASSTAGAGGAGGAMAMTASASTG